MFGTGSASCGGSAGLTGRPGRGVRLGSPHACSQPISAGRSLVCNSSADRNSSMNIESNREHRLAYCDRRRGVITCTRPGTVRKGMSRTRMPCRRRRRRRRLSKRREAARKWRGNSPAAARIRVRALTAGSSIAQEPRSDCHRNSEAVVKREAVDGAPCDAGG